MDIPLTPILAGVEGVITLVFVMFSIFAWIINLVGSKSKVTPPAPSRPKSRSGRSERSDIFLEDDDFATTRPSRPAPPPRPQRTPPAPTPKSKTKRPAVTSGMGSSSVTGGGRTGSSMSSESGSRNRPGSGIANRPTVGHTDLGSGVRSHVAAEAKRSTIDQSVAEHFRPRVDENSTAATGARPVVMSSTDTAAPEIGSSEPVINVRKIVQALHNPESVRQAMIINAILTPPMHRPGGRSTSII